MTPVLVYVLRGRGAHCLRVYVLAHCLKVYDCVGALLEVRPQPIDRQRLEDRKPRGQPTCDEVRTPARLCRAIVSDTHPYTTLWSVDRLVYMQTAMKKEEEEEQEEEQEQE